MIKQEKKKLKIREKNRYLHQECPNCGYKWDDNEMIFETDDNVMKILRRKESKL